MRLQISGYNCCKAGSVLFCIGRRNLSGGCQASGSKSSHCSGSSQQRMRGEREEKRDKVRWTLWRKIVYASHSWLMCTLAACFRSTVHTEHISIKHSNQPGRETRCHFGVSISKQIDSKTSVNRGAMSECKIMERIHHWVLKSIGVFMF